MIKHNLDDCDRTLRTLQRERVVNDVFVVRDREQALDVFSVPARMRTAGSKMLPIWFCLELKLPKVGGMEIGELAPQVNG
jgi:hypothetical protein